MLLLNIPASVLVQNRLVILGAITVLSTATVFSILFAWATGTLFGRRQIATESGMSSVLHRIKQELSWLIGVGFAGGAIPILVAVVYFSSLQRETEQHQQIGRANIGISKKCAEIAALERGLFQSDEQFVMTQCLLQYDRTYAALHERSVH
ncbi:hypothetical protein [Herbaspirillum sp. GCM10030257]|uniref:hypothetical protein n=1 Tax=Herbaspirillum sp. GCM10030257 TaxID=3273393 RepID=UPI0036D26BD7